MSKHALILTPTGACQARLNHDKRVAAARAKLKAANAKVERNRIRGANKALQRAAARFLSEGEEIGAPRVFDLVRWPYAGEPKVRDIPQELRDTILEEDTLCVWCRESPSTTIDHVHPLNLVGACGRCNYIKSDFMPWELGWILRLPLRAFALGTAI